MEKADQFIDIDNAYELWDWADKLKVSAECLRVAVQTVGSSSSAVKFFLENRNGR
ncbi:MAG: DUF3606 domain-containing protein [Bacteroidia bacterium]